MLDRLPYHPEINMMQIREFDACIQNVSGAWTVIRSFVHGGDPRVIQLRWIINDEQWCDPSGFLTFLDRQEHRTLLRCFLQSSVIAPTLWTPLVKRGISEDEETLLPSRDTYRTWSFDRLLQCTGLHGERKALERMLHFLQIQEMIEVLDGERWYRGPQLMTVPNLGATFEWIVQEHLQRFHHALARRCVCFKEWQAFHLNDLDVLAFIDNQILLVECKSSTEMSPDHLFRFVQRATMFPATLALLLIDTPTDTQITKRLQQLNAILSRETTDLGHLYHYNGSLIAYLTDNIWVANTAGGIAASLDGVIFLSAELKNVE